MIYLRKYEMGYVSQFLNALPRQTAYDIVLKSALETFGADEEERATWETERMLRHFDIDESLWLLYPRTFFWRRKASLEYCCRHDQAASFAAARRANCLVGRGVEGEGA